MYPEIVLSLALGTGLVVGLVIGFFAREISRLAYGIFVTSYDASTLREAEDIGDAGAGDTRIMVFEVTKRGKGPNK